MKTFTIPVYRPDLGGKEKAYVNECLETSWISSRGKFVSAFEEEFARYVEVPHAASVSNGTVALHLALMAMGIGPGDEVIVPTLTYVASVNAIAYTGAAPIFADSERRAWQMDPDDVRRLITPRTRALMIVHLYGHPTNMGAMMDIASEYRLAVIEDCAEAFGTYYKGKHVGTFGDIATFSFFGNKTITTGEGGMVVSNDRTLIERARHLKGQGLAAYREYWHDVIGYNYRMTNVQAAIGLAQLERADEFVERKRLLAQKYAELLADLPLTFQEKLVDATHSYWMVSVLAEDAETRDALRSHLSAKGIETRPVFFPVHTMPMYSRNYRRHPVAEDISWRGINLPSWPGLNEIEMSYICAAIREYYEKRS